MRLSEYFLPLLKEEPAEAQIVSHRLMLRGGMIRQQASGIYAWLPLGLRVLRKIENIVRLEMDKAGCQEVLMPTLQPADLWRESGRYDDYGEEMLRIVDRHKRDLLYGPTNEEMITAIFRNSVKSYRELPKNLYHIQWKFRDEIRPRFGVMRGREFMMKDAYSFDLTPEGARISYLRMFATYLRIFSRLGVKAIPMKADTGPIGGDLSHEFIILADTGESGVLCHRDLLDMDTLNLKIEDDAQLEDMFRQWSTKYAVTDEMHDPKDIGVLINPEDLVEARGIEVGHIFNFGTKYSEAMNCVVAKKGETSVPLEMGSYGIGISRIVGAIIEASHDDMGIIWPDAVAPFDVNLISLTHGNSAIDEACASLLSALEASDRTVLFDDTQERPGAKFAVADLIGLPWQIIVGPRGLKEGAVEIKRRATGEKSSVSFDKVIEFLDHGPKS